MWLILVLAHGVPLATTALAGSLAGHPAELTIGRPAPDFNLTLFSGERITLDSFRGSAVIINFWHSMCDHCQREAPVLEAAYEKYRKQGLVIIGVNIRQDDEQLARDFAERHKLTFPVGHDAGDIGPLYAFKALPATVFIDRAGTLVERYGGELTAVELRQRIEDLLK